MADNRESASSSLVAERSELQNQNPLNGSQKFAASRDNSAGGDSSENTGYLATDPALQITLGGSLRKSPFMLGSPMSLKSSTYSSKPAGFDHRSMLCLSPPANVNGAPLPTSNKGARLSNSRQEKKGLKAEVPSINLKTLAGEKDQPEAAKHGPQEIELRLKQRLKTPSPVPSKTTNHTSVKNHSAVNTELGQSRNQDSTFISGQLTPNSKAPMQKQYCETSATGI